YSWKSTEKALRPRFARGDVPGQPRRGQGTVNRTGANGFTARERPDTPLRGGAESGEAGSTRNARHATILVRVSGYCWPAAARRQEEGPCLSAAGRRSDAAASRAAVHRPRCGGPPRAKLAEYRSKGRKADARRSSEIRFLGGNRFRAPPRTGAYRLVITSPL